MRVFTLFFLVLLVPSVSAESIKIGFIDTEFVVNNLIQYREGRTFIAKEFESKKQELLDLFNNIELVRSNLNDIDQSKNKEDFQIELDKILELELIFKRDTEFWQTSINQKQVDLLKEIEVIINNAIKEFASEENYDLILYENVAFATDNVDISNKIISKIENKSP